MTRLRELSRDDLATRRDALLRDLGISYEEFLERAKQRSLVGDEWAVWDELQEIEFLMGDEPDRK